MGGGEEDVMDSVVSRVRVEGWRGGGWRCLRLVHRSVVVR